MAWKWSITSVAAGRTPDRGGVATEGVDRRDVDAVGPPHRLQPDPVTDDVTGSAWDDVEQPAPADVDEGGRHLRASVGVGVLERVLVDAELGVRSRR